MDHGQYTSLVFEKEFEEDCAKLCGDVRVMDDHLRACDYLISRAGRQRIDIPTVPGTNVQVFRLDGRRAGEHMIPPTRVFFQFKTDGKAHMLAIEPIPPQEYYEDLHEGEQLAIPFEDDESGV